MPASLTDLPRELRDIVYHHLWQSDPQLDFRGTYKDFFCAKYVPHLPTRRTDYHFGQERSLPTGLPQWLCTNTMLLEEGIDVFVRNSEIVLCNTEVHDSFGCPDWSARLYIPDKFPMLLHPSKSLLLFITITTEDNWWEEGQPWCEWDPDANLFCRALFEDVSKHFNLKELRLRIMAYRLNLKATCSMALAPLELMICIAVRTINRLEVYIALDSAYYHESVLAMAESTLSFEVAKINCGVLQAFDCDGQENMIGARVYEENLICGWKLLWTRARPTKHPPRAQECNEKVGYCNDRHTIRQPGMGNEESYHALGFWGRLVATFQLWRTS